MYIHSVASYEDFIYCDYKKCLIIIVNHQAVSLLSHTVFMDVIFTEGNTAPSKPSLG